MALLYPSESGPVFYYPNTPGPYIGAVVFELFLYGIYMILFLTYAAIIFSKSHIIWVPLIAATLMFVIASIDVGYTLNLLFRKILVHGLEYEELRPKYIMYVVNSMIADAFLIYKLYLVFEYNKWVIIGPVWLLAAATGCGFVFEGINLDLSQHSWINISLTVATNVLVTSLMAGKILYVGTYGRALLGVGMPHAVSMCAALMVETGTLYTLYVSLDLAFRTNPSVNIILDGGLIQIVGIMPTLLLVQISIGRASNIGTPSYMSSAAQQATGTASFWSDEARTHPYTADIPLSDAVSRIQGSFQAV